MLKQLSVVSSPFAHRSKSASITKRSVLLLVITFICGCQLWGYDLYVSPNGSLNGTGAENSPYLLVQQAIDHAFDDSNPDNANGPSVVIKLSDNLGGYNESLNVLFHSNYNEHNVSNITICSMSNNPSNCAIIASDGTPVIGVQGTTNSKLTLQGIEIKHNVAAYGNYSGVHFLNNCIDILKVDNCLFNNNVIAIQFDYWADINSELTVTNSIFYLNQIVSGYSHGVLAQINGPTANRIATFTDNQFINVNPAPSDVVAIEFGNGFSEVNIHDNQFTYANVTELNDNNRQDISILNNSFHESSLTLSSRGNWLIKNNKFIGQSEVNDRVIYLGGGSSTTPTLCSIDHNLFYGNYMPVIIRSGDVNCFFRTYASLNGNSFIDCTNLLSLKRRSNMQSNSNSITEYKNNLSTGTGNSPFEIIDQDNDPLVLSPVMINDVLVDRRIPISYSHFTTDLSTNPSLVIGDNVSFGNAQIDVDPANYSYSLNWDTSVKSPCINNGYPGPNNELTDPDGTPPDIGCVYYSHYNSTPLHPELKKGSIDWLCFPVIDNRSVTNGTYWNELGFMFNAHMQGPPTSQAQLGQIQWSYAGLNPTMEYQEPYWSFSSQRTSQPVGYKVKFNDVEQIDLITVNGFKVDPVTTPATWVISTNVNGQNLPFENWIGYYVPFTQRAGDALSRLLPNSTRDRYIDYIYAIKARTWSICRMSEEPNSPWIGDPNRYTLSEGDMVSLLLLHNAPLEMYWAMAIHSQPILRAQATAFTYDEKMDYTPVFIEFDPDDMPSEVGIYVDGECMGAAVVDSTITDVCFYKEDAKDNQELEIMFYYEGKGKKLSKGWKSYNPEKMVFEDSSIRVNDIGSYAYLSFFHKNGESLTPLITSLQPNYPNPFNPSTNISFILARDMEAQLDIYNVRGQKVKTLNNAKLAKGKHTVVWDGKDDHGQSVSSGVYFSRLTTPDGSFIHKMMMIK